MAVVNQLNSTALNLYPHPQPAVQFKGLILMQIRRVFTITSGDSTNSIYLLGYLPDTATVNSIKIEAANTVTSVTAATVGLWDSQGILKNASCYSSGLDLASSSGTTLGNFGGNVYTCGSRSLTAAAAVQPVWADAGDVEGPFPASGSTLKDDSYQVGLQLNAGAGATIVCISYITYEMAAV